MTAAELIAKVKATGVETFVSQMRSSERAMQGVGNAGKSAGTMLLAGFAGPATLVAGIVGGRLLSGVESLGRGMIESALNMERLTGTFQALSGSATIAAQKMEYLKRFATSSIGEFKDLAEAGAQLEASGLHMERVIPTISSMAAAFGGARDQIMELASAFGRLKSGQFGESMEIFRRFGISARDLMQQGIRVNAGGQVVGDWEKVFGAIERIADRKFGGIGRVMGKSLNVAFSNLRDSWDQTLAEMGKGFFPLIAGFTQAAGKFLDFLRGSGEAAKIGKSFADAAKAITGISGGGLTHFFALATATIEQLPQLAIGIRDFVASGINAALDGVVALVNVWRNGFTDIKNEWFSFGDWFSNSLTSTFHWIVDNLQTLLSYMSMGAIDKPDPLNVPTQISLAKEARPKQYTRDDLGVDIANALKGIDGKLFGGAFGNIAKRAEEIEKAMAKFAGSGGVPDKSNFPVSDSITNPLNTIAAYTMKVAENTAPLSDLRRIVMGGGPLAQMGATPAEIAAARGPIQVRVQGGMNRAFEQFMEDMIAQALNQAHRQGSPFAVTAGGRR